MRIIFCFLLLIISQFSFASVSTSGGVVPASSNSGFYVSSSTLGSAPSASSKEAACQSAAAFYTSNSSLYDYFYSYITTSICYLSRAPKGASATRVDGYSFNSIIIYSCPSGYLSDSSGNASDSGQYCNNIVTIDSCSDYAGQTGFFWVSKVSVPQTICSGTCLATVGSYSNFPEADPNSWQGQYYTYTGETAGCTVDSGFTDEATAVADNAAAAERERLKKIEQAIAAAKTACGGEGHYTIGTFNGNTVVTCKDTGIQTTTTGDVTTTTVTNADGSTTTTTTTTTNNTSTTNNNSSTTINSNGSTSSSGGASGSTSGTTTSVVTRAPDGTVIASSTSGSSTTSGGVGTCDQDGMADKIACSEFGEIPADGIIPSETIDLSNLAVGASWWSNNAACIADVQIAPSIIFSYQPLCNLLSFMRPIIIGVAFIIAAFITLGFNKKEGD